MGSLAVAWSDARPRMAAAAAPALGSAEAAAAARDADGGQYGGELPRRLRPTHHDFSGTHYNSTMSHDPGAESRLGELMLEYLAACIVLLSCVSIGLWARRTLQRQSRSSFKEDGILVSSSWPRAIRYCISAVLICLVVVPPSLLVTSVGFAAALSKAEHWSFPVAYKYVISSVASLENPLTNASPGTFGGDVMDVIISLFQFLLSSTVTGLVSSLALVNSMASGISPTWGGLARYTLVYVPVTMLLVITLCGYGLAYLEGWELRAGFLYMASSILGVPTPLTQVVPVTDIGQVFDITAVIGEISFTGALVGVIGGHVKVMRFLQLMEGQPAEAAAEAPAPAVVQGPEQPGAGCLERCCLIGHDSVDLFEDDLMPVGASAKAFRKLEPSPQTRSTRAPGGESGRWSTFFSKGGRQSDPWARHNEIQELLRLESEEVQRCQQRLAQHQWKMHHLWEELQQAREDAAGGIGDRSYSRDPFLMDRAAPWYEANPDFEDEDRLLC